MNSKLYSLGGRMGNIGVSELPKDKAKADVVCSVLFLDGTTQCFNISKQDDGQILLDMVYIHLGLMEREFFCLQLVEDPSDSPRWLEPNKPIKKQHKGSYPCRLSFRVRFFVADPNSLLQEQTRHFYFLQLKNDIQNGRLNCPLSSAVVLASYAVQSEFGDHSPSEHPPGYLSSSNFLPKQDDDFLTKVESLHLQHSGLKSSEAELCYLNTARTLEFYGVELHRGRDSSNADLSVGIASGGVAIFRNMICSSFFSWVNIIKLSFKRKRFYIQLKQKRENRDTGVSFHMPNNRACKNLWRSCVEHHTFFQARSPLPQDKKLFSNYWTFSSKNPSKSLNNQIFQKLMGGMAWNPVLRRSISGEHLETKSLPSRSPPITPNWRSPRLRHNIRKPPHSSMENLGNEMSYVTESEDVFYTYRGTLASGGSDDEAQTDPCVSQKKLHVGDETEDATRKLPHSNTVSRPGSGEAVWSVPGPLEGIDLENAPGDKADDPDSQYYCNKNDVIEGDLLLVRITPDKEGKFGFNVKGGVDQRMPLVISRVSLDSPAGKCVPPLLEGDQIVLINGRDISEHTHDQVVMFIKASRESHTKELALLVRRKGVGLRVESQHEYKTFPVFGDPISPSSYQCGGTLSESMVHLKRGLQNGVLLAQFEQLYRKKPGLSMSVAKSSQNMEKNRYKDVLPYDITRVVLGEEEDGYINASHVKMEIPAAGIVNQYMASQGPLPHTCGHFWQAVWEQQVCVIVMLTTLTERGRPKCHQYWPDPPEVRDYGCLRVCCHSEECNLAYVFRQLTLTNNENGEERTVTHLQYVAWPDHGVPDDPSDFLDFVNFVQHQKGEGEPLVVHCSAGIGRTGVFITMETAMKLMEKDQPVHPLDLVRRLRDQRAMMVQTVSQYRFVCEAILRVYRERQDGALSPNS